MPHEAAGTVPQVANPIRLSESPVAYDRPPPMLGEHTADVLCGLLGLGADEVAALRDEGIV